MQPLLTAPNDPTDYTIERWIVLALVLLFLLPFVAGATPVETEPELVSLDGVTAGSLLLKTSRPGAFVAAPMVSNDIAVQVRGIVARARFRQTFENTSGICVEAIYAFPLPDDAAIDAMSLTIGVRRIRGEIREREEAARVYEQAKSEGRKASLLEQHRADLFTVSVASIAPGESVEVEIEYQHKVRYEDGRFSIRVPSVVAPRFMPGAPPEPAGADRALATPASHGLPRMEYRQPGERPRSFRLEVALDAGLPLREIVSETHPIESIRTGSGTWQVVVGERASADRDFRLSWAPEHGSEPRIASFTESSGGQTWTLIMAVPPETRAPMGLMSREVIFILDTSGSMLGTSLHEARAALLLALGRLRASDWFNVIEFNSETSSLWEESRAATPDAVDRARRFVESLEATGGTHMRPALELALGSALLPARPVRQIVFITDGQVGNEQELFGVIDRGLGEARLFTVGIGSAPNGSFMRHAARRGRGTATFIPGADQVASSMEGLFRKIENPVLSGVTLDLGPGAEVWPERIPDLYAGEPLVALARIPGRAASARITAHDPGGAWEETVALGAVQPGEGIAKLWAREKIESLVDGRAEGVDPAQIRSKVIEVALAHHLVSPYTSLVAVDATPAGVDPEGCVSTLVPLDLPAGWGGTDLAALPQTGTGGRALLLAGLALALFALILRRAI